MIKILTENIHVMDTQTIGQTNLLSFFLQHKKGVVLEIQNEKIVACHTYDSYIKQKDPYNMKSIEWGEGLFDRAKEFFHQNHYQTVIPVCDKNGAVCALLEDDLENDFTTVHFDRAPEEFAFLKEYDAVVSSEVTEATFNFIQKITMIKNLPPIYLVGEDWNSYSEILSHPDNVNVTMELSGGMENKKIFDTKDLFQYFSPRIVWFLDNSEQCINLIRQIGKTSYVIGYAANEEAQLEKYGQAFGDNIERIPIARLAECDFDAVAVCAENAKDAVKQLACGLYIPKNKIWGKKDLLKAKMIEKYRFSADYEIQSILGYWKNNELSVFNQSCQHNEHGFDGHVEWDKDVNMPYVIFFGKRMYLPRDCKYIQESSYGGELVAGDLMSEQALDSPHLYLDEQTNVKAGDVILDAGVCEGNFALRFVDIASKIYLVECNEEWMEALRLTFEPWKDKVIFCDKFLAGTSGNKKITIDRLIDGGKLDFIKMDIEGAEVEALLGARKAFENNNIRASICAYHRENDEAYIRWILEKYGYETYTNNKYMVFGHDPDIYSAADFRHGIVHAYKAKG